MNAQLLFIEEIDHDNRQITTIEVSGKDAKECVEKLYQSFCASRLDIDETWPEPTGDVEQDWFNVLSEVESPVLVLNGSLVHAPNLVFLSSEAP